MKDKLKTKYTLMSLLSDYRVVIPKVQRDYAQGREGERIGYIRKTFLDKIWEGLKDNKEVRLDFVYGTEKYSEKHDVDEFFPLDGQQRLTTLWLVHWYVFFMVYMTKPGGRFPHKKFEDLSRFTYETRESSRDFFRCLCDIDNIRELKTSFDDGRKDGLRLADVIGTRTWFMTEWLNDPTISAMLRTLSGGKDCIESIIVTDHGSGAEWEAWERFCETLMARDKFTFELQRFGVKELPEEVADLMYIIMNGRGKALSDFENLKVDILDEITKKTSAKVSLEYAARIDNVWTNVVWDEVKDSDNKDTAPLLFSFINRYVVNELCFEVNDESGKCLAAGTYSKGLKTIDSKAERRIRSHFDKVYGVRLGRGKDPDDGLVRYDGFECYKDQLNVDTVAELDRIFFGLLSDKNCLSVIKKVWEEINPAYSFIPRFRNEDADGTGAARSKEAHPARTVMAERLYFYATCRFIRCRIDKDEKGSWYWKHEFSETEYRHWMRVARNLISNCYFVDVSIMVAVIRKLKECFPDEIISGDVYDKLAEKAGAGAGAAEAGASAEAGTRAEKKTAERFMAQFAEECEKACLLKESSDWEKRIDEAENYGFFDGSIRFLYRDGSGLPVWGDMSHFDTKFIKAKELFPDSEDGKVPADTAWEFLRYFRDIDEIEKKTVFTPFGYNDRNPNWKTDILCSREYAGQVDMMLRGASSEAVRSDDLEAFLKAAKKEERKIFHEDAKGKYWITEAKPGAKVKMEIKNAQGAEPLYI